MLALTKMLIEMKIHIKTAKWLCYQNKNNFVIFEVIWLHVLPVLHILAEKRNGVLQKY